MEVSFGRTISAMILQLVLVFLFFCNCNLQYTVEEGVHPFWTKTPVLCVDLFLLCK